MNSSQVTMNAQLFACVFGVFICQLLATAEATEGCSYQGKVYLEDASWPVACDSICTCNREGGIFYMSCKEMCPDMALPPGCTPGYKPTRSMTLSRDCCPIAICR
ncbi:uncharacterized protein LOC135469858 [Liolophura sinensis]|uniref:uncharacterized protein LOC135469858 n=1 Tax=Liolophura sinensis TaxID=3198878 RepID=UPI0031592F5B